MSLLCEYFGNRTANLLILTVCVFTVAIFKLLLQLRCTVNGRFFSYNYCNAYFSVITGFQLQLVLTENTVISD